MSVRPRLGFLGVGWIGQHRLRAIATSGVADVVGICDDADDAVAAALAVAPGARHVPTYDALLELALDGVVIATPSALHSAQSVRALERGVAVFCQKPLARTAAEARRVVDAARLANRLLGVDLSYRHTAAMREIARLNAAGALGRVHSVDMTFHNAYGPDKPWFYDPALAGGGCVMDLGVHLIDLALWCLGFPAVAEVRSRLLAQGSVVTEPRRQVEDFATAELRIDHNVLVRLACSWHLHAGRDCVLEIAFHGTDGGASMRNVDGSFHDFVAERYRGTSRETLASPPDEWGGRAAVAWAQQLAAGVRFVPESEQHVAVASVLDRLYGRRAAAGAPPAVTRLPLVAAAGER